MNRLARLVLIVAFAAVLLSDARAQYTPPAPSRPFPGFINEYLRAPNPYLSAWDIGVNVRLRLEEKLGAGTTDAGSNWDFSRRPVDDTFNRYGLTRVMPRVGYTAKWYSFTIEGRSSYSYGDERFNPAAAGRNLPELDGPLDLYQAFLFVGNHKEFPVSLKLGRQELVYGEQRLLGHSRWLNNPRSFDAAKVRYQNGLVGIDVFAAAPVYVDHGNLNRSNSQDLLYGAYLNFPRLSANHLVEAYLIERNVKRGIVTDNWSPFAAPSRFPAPQDVTTAGVRVKSKPGVTGPWDYGIEAMYQFGERTAVFPATTVAAAAAAPRLDHSAWAAIGQVGYAWSAPWSPRLALIGSIGSGDKNPADRKSGTFQNLFPSNHGFYGQMDLNSLQNFQELRLVATFKPKPTLSLAIEGHVQWLDRTSDYWYNVAGVPRNFAGAAAGSGRGYRVNPTYGSAIGQEIDLLAGWSFTPSATLEAGYGHFFRGDYIKESLSAVGSRDANYAYLQLTLTL